MAHSGEEGALRIVGPIGFLARGLQLGDVVVDGVGAHASVFHDEWHDDDLDLDGRAVLTTSAGDLVDPSGLDGTASKEMTLGTHLVRRHHQIIDVPTDGVVGLVLEEPGGRRVPAGHLLIFVHRHDRSRTDRNQGFEVCLLRGKLRCPLVDPSLQGLDVVAQLGRHLVERLRQDADLVLSRDGRLAA